MTTKPRSSIDHSNGISLIADEADHYALITKATDYVIVRNQQDAIIWVKEEDQAT